MLDNNTWNHVQTNEFWLVYNVIYRLFINKSFIYKQDLVLNYQQGLICLEIQPTQSLPYEHDLEIETKI